MNDDIKDHEILFKSFWIDKTMDNIEQRNTFVTKLLNDRK